MSEWRVSRERGTIPAFGVSVNVGSLFSGIGLLDYGLHLAGFQHSWLCELQPERREILGLRFPEAVIYHDVRTLGDAAPVDVIAGGFPCKGISSAGTRSGFGHPETALWREMLRIIRELRPRYVIVENVADLLALERGELFGEVLGGLAESGYDAEWDCFPAAAFGAPHGRDRVFVTAVDDSDASSVGCGRIGVGTRPVVAHTNGAARRTQRDAPPRAGVAASQWDDLAGRGVTVGWGRYEPAIQRWESILGRPAPEPLIRRMDDGSSTGLERSALAALGDGVLVQAGWLVGERLMQHVRSLSGVEHRG
jgi:DNA (cytosine-5)-methyltransferase 1